MVPLKDFFGKINLIVIKKIHSQQKSMQNYPACKEIRNISTLFVERKYVIWNISTWDLISYCTSSCQVWMNIFRQLPWMQYADQNLWISTLNTIKCYKVRHDGTVVEESRRRLHLRNEDVSRFVVKNNTVVSGCR